MFDTPSWLASFVMGRKAVSMIGSRLVCLKSRIPEAKMDWRHVRLWP